MQRYAGKHIQQYIMEGTNHGSSYPFDSAEGGKAIPVQPVDGQRQVKKAIIGFWRVSFEFVHYCNSSVKGQSPEVAQTGGK